MCMHGVASAHGVRVMWRVTWCVMCVGVQVAAGRTHTAAVVDVELDMRDVA